MSLINVNLLDKEKVLNFRKSIDLKNSFDCSVLLCEKYGFKIENLEKNKFYKTYLEINSDKMKNISDDINKSIEISKDNIKNEKEKYNKKKQIITKNRYNKIKKWEENINFLNKKKKNIEYDLKFNLKNSTFYNLYFENDKGKYFSFFVVLNHKYSIASYFLVNSVLYKDYCGHLNIFGKEQQNNFYKNFAFIEWIYPSKICGINLNGTDILNLLINICYLNKVYRVDLQDESRIITCPKTELDYANIDLRLLKLFKDGKSWYEKYDFLPSIEKKLRNDYFYKKPNKTTFKVSYKGENYNKYYDKYKKSISIIRNFDTRYLLEILENIYNNPEFFVTEYLNKKIILKLGNFILIIKDIHRKNKVFKLQEIMNILYKKDCAYYHIFVKFILGKGTFFKPYKKQDIFNLIFTTYRMKRNTELDKFKSLINERYYFKEIEKNIFDLFSSFSLISKTYYYSRILK